MIKKISNFLLDSVLATLFILFGVQTPVNASVDTAVEKVVEIQFSAHSMVTSHQQVYLKDIAKFNYATLEQEMALGNVSLGLTLDPEEELSLLSEDIAKVLNKNLHLFKEAFGPTKIKLSMPDRITVASSENDISYNSVSFDLFNSYKKLCDNCSFSLKNISIPKLKTVKNKAEITIDYSQVKLTGPFLIPVLVKQDEKQEQYWISGQMVIKQKGLLATRMIQGGQVLTESDFKKGDVEITFQKDQLVTDFSQLKGSRLNRFFTKDQAVFMSNLKKELVLNRGMNVKALLGTENMEISVNATAEEAGAIGDIIRIKTSDTGKILSGLIVEKGLVEIQ